MAKVNREFFEQHQSECPTSDSLSYADCQGKEGTRGVFAASSHGCGVLYADKLNEKGILFEVMAKPDDWVFMIEGSEHYSDENYDMLFSELPYFKLLADVLNIPTRDPIISLWDDRTLTLFESRTGTTKMDFAIANAFLNLAMLQSKIPHLPESKLIELSLKWSEQEFQDYHVVLNIEELTKRFYEELKVPEGKDRDEYVESKIAYSRKLVFSTDPISNELSGDLARKLLAETGRKKALFIIGAGHFSVQQIYRP